MTDTAQITLEQVEALAEQLADEAETRRAKLRRLITAYARILAVREPEIYRPRSCWHGDEAGHWDSSFPPEQEYGDHTGPRLLRIIERETEDIPTSGGYYHAWRRVTTDLGLYVGRGGRLWGGDETGTGEVGQYAAYPGDHHVDCAIEWDTLDANDIATEQLVETEQRLRELAFPRVAALVA